MTIIANKPFTQLTNLNVIDELRINGVLVTGTAQQIVEVSADYIIDIDDDFIIVTGDVNITLLPIGTAKKEVTIKANPFTLATMIPFGSDQIETGGELVSSFTSVSLLPTSGGWVII